MKPILEEENGGRLLSPKDRDGSMLSLSSVARSGIKMGSVSLRTPRSDSYVLRPLDPSSIIEGQGNPSLPENKVPLTSMLPSASSYYTQSDSDKSIESESESDWERDITEEGSVHFIQPLISEEEIGGSHRPSIDINKPPNHGQDDEKGKKLSRLVRRRESKRDRNTTTSVVLKTPGGHIASKAAWRASNSHESSDNDSSTYGQIKTFEAFFEATNLDHSISSPAPPMPEKSRLNDLLSKDEVTEIHEVTLKFQSKQLKAQIPHFQMLLHGDNPANRGLLLETLFGIIPEVKPFSDECCAGNLVDNSVVIAGFAPHKNSHKWHDHLQCGDIIRSLDGHHITLDSVNTYLLNKLTKASSSSSTGKVKLILQRPVGGIPDKSKKLPTAITEEELHEKRQKIVKQFSRADEHVWNVLQSANVTAAIISNNTLEESDEAPTVLYRMMRSVKAKKNEDSVLINIRGILSTLLQLLPDILSSEPVNASFLIMSNVHGAETPYSSLEQFHVFLAIDSDETLFIGIPASRVPDHLGCHLADELLRFIILKHGSLEKAAKSPAAELDNIIGRYLHDSIFGRHSDALKDLQTFISEAPVLQLPDDIHFQVEDALNQFESCDFQDFSEEFYDMPREFVVAGSCLFHRGYVVASHLSTKDLRDVELWLKCTNIIDLTRSHPVRKVVVWQELHETRTDEYRRFLLVSGLGYQLIGVVLEMGGYTSNQNETVGPDPFYVDQAVNTLEHLSEMGIHLVCEKWLTLPHNPSLMDFTNVISASSRVKKLNLKSDSNQGPSSFIPGVVLKRTKSLELSESSSTTPDGGSPLPADGDECNFEMSTAFRGDDKDTSSSWELPRGSRRMMGTASIHSSAGASHSTTSTDAEADDLVTYHVSKLSISLDNTLIYFLNLQEGQGVFLAPTSKQESGNSLHLNRQLFDNFRSGVELIHGILKLSSSQRQNAEEMGKWSNKSLAALKEHGMLFRWTASENLPVFSYWVCGRLYHTPEPKECYVAYHESTPQQLVEMAFRLSFGIHL